MNQRDRQRIARRLAADEEVDKAIQEGVRKALAHHRSLKNPVAVWRDGKVVVLSPEELAPEEEPKP